MNEFKILLQNVTHQKKLVAQVYYKKTLWVEISHDEDETLIRFYNHPVKTFWEFTFDEAISILEKARAELLLSLNS